MVRHVLARIERACGMLSDGSGIIEGVGEFDFDAELWLWDARRSGTWVFLSVPPGGVGRDRGAGCDASAVRVRIGAGRGSDRVDGVADVIVPGGRRPVCAAGEAVGPGG